MDKNITEATPAPAQNLFRPSRHPCAARARGTAGGVLLQDAQHLPLPRHDPADQVMSAEDLADATLTIGGLGVALAFEGGASAPGRLGRGAPALRHAGPLAWDAGRETPPRLRVRDGQAADADHPELLADGRLWTLRRDPATGARRLAILGCPWGPLSMTLDLDPPMGGPLSGVLSLGPPPEGRSKVPLGYPLMPLLWTILLGRLGEADGGLLCHACGVVTPAGDGLLFAGFSGAGKSTTSRLWRAACPGAAILSDDRVILRRDSVLPLRLHPARHPLARGRRGSQHGPRPAAPPPDPGPLPRRPHQPPCSPAAGPRRRAASCPHDPAHLGRRRHRLPPCPSPPPPANPSPSPAGTSPQTRRPFLNCCLDTLSMTHRERPILRPRVIMESCCAKGLPPTCPLPALAPGRG